MKPATAFRVRPLPSLFGVLLLVQSDDGRSYRLNDEFPLVPDGDVQSFELSRDGKWVAYWARDGSGGAKLFSATTDRAFGPVELYTPPNIFSYPRFTDDGERILFALGYSTWLYSVPSDGSAPAVLLSYGVSSFQVTPDSARVLFLADLFTNDRYVLCSVPVDGSSPPIVVNSPMPTYGADVERFAISPDGARVVYVADAFADFRYELFSARVDVAASGIHLGGPLTPYRFDFSISPDGSRVVFESGRAIHSVPIDGSAPAVPLTGPRVEEFVPSPDGTRVAYRASPPTGGPVELSSVPIDGSAAPTVLATGDDVQYGLAVSPDGARVVYRADTPNDLINLFSVPIDGSALPRRLNPPLPPGADVQPGFVIAPDSSRVAFLAGPAGAPTLLGVPLDGSSSPLVLDDDALPLSELSIGADSVHVFYRRGIWSDEHLWSARLDGSAPAVQLSGGTDLGYFRVGPRGTGVAYTADEDFRGVSELFARPATGGGSSFQLSSEFTHSIVEGTVRQFRAGQDRAVYVADNEASGDMGLFSVLISGGRAPFRFSTGSGAPMRIEPSLPIALGAGGSRVVFHGYTGAIRELYSAPLDGSAAPIVLNGPLTPYGRISTFVISADGTQVVYSADQDTRYVNELYRAAIEVPASPVKLSGSMPAFGDVGFGFQVTADGSRAIYVADQETDGVIELYSADGTAPPIKLSGAMVAGGGVLYSQLSADGTLVFYLGDQIVDDRVELFGVPSDGSAAPLALSGTIVPGGDVSSLLGTPDGLRVLFIADRETNDKPELYTARSDGSGAIGKLNPTGTLGRYVSGFALDPAGTVAVFRYNSQPDTHELYSAPVDASAPPVLLTPLPRNREVLLDPAFRVSADGERVVYLANQDRGYYDLYSVPVDGSDAPVRLNTTDQLPGYFQIGPAGKRVLYAARLSLTGAYEVFVVPIDGNQAPVLLGPPSVPDGGVPSDLAFALDGSAALFRLDARQRYSHDLYAAPLERGPHEE